MTLLVLAISILIAGWVAGSLLLRTGGLLAIAAGLAIAPSHPAGLALAIAGALTWLTGHWLYAVRHHRYRSPLARRLYLQALPPRLDATRNWTTDDPDREQCHD